MKKLSVLALALISTAVFAGSDDSASNTAKNSPYIGVEAGNLSVSGDGISKTNQGKYGIFGGVDLVTYQGLFVPTTLAVEGELATSRLNSSTFNSGINLTNLSLELVPKLHINNNLSFIGKFGVSYDHLSGTNSGSGWSSNSQTSFKSGLGLEYQFTPQISARLTVDSSKKSGPTQNSTLLGVAYKF